MRADVKDIEKMLEDYHFLKNNHISTYEELQKHKSQSTNEYNALLTVKRELDKQIKLSPDDDFLQNKRTKTKAELKEKTGTIKMCIRVEERTKHMYENLEQQRKEQTNERRIRCSQQRSEFTP